MTTPQLPSVPLPTSSALSLDVKAEPVKRALAVFTEAGLINPEQARSLGIAANNLAVMKAVSSPASQRHFSRIDTIMTVRGATPVSEAREALSGMAKVWDGLDTEFHRFRTLMYETKLIRARMKKRAAEITEMSDGDDKDIATAEVELELSKLAGMEADLAKGQAKLKGELEKATTYSDQYKLICKTAGKGDEGFTEADFRSEEISYYLKSAFWHSSQVFETDDQRDKYDRKPGYRDPRESDRSYDFREQLKARKTMEVVLPEEVKLAFQVMGILDHEVKAEIKALEEMRFNFNLSHPRGVHSFADHFDSWLSNVTEKFRSRVSSTLVGNMDKFKRVQQLLKADAGDSGTKGDVGKIERRSVIQ